MSETQVILIYSKYSPHCKPITDIIGDVQDARVKFVCIDNKATREKLLSSKSINIRSVPCVVLRHKDGSLEKFEGDNVSSWIQTNLPTKPKYTKISALPQSTPDPPAEHYNKPIPINGGIPDKPPFDVRGGMTPHVQGVTNPSKQSAAEIARQTELEREGMEASINPIGPAGQQRPLGVSPPQGQFPPGQQRPSIPQMNQPPLPTGQQQYTAIQPHTPMPQSQQPPPQQQYQPPPQQLQPPPQQYQPPPQQQYQPPPQQQLQGSPGVLPQGPAPQLYQPPTNVTYAQHAIEAPKITSGLSASDMARQMEQERGRIEPIKQ